MTDLYTRTPVNKTASLVVSQNGCEDEQSAEDKRECLVKAVKRIDMEIAALPKKHGYRKDLGIQKFNLCTKISNLNKEIRKKNSGDKDLDRYILDICRRSMSRGQWQAILAQARGLKTSSQT